MKPSTSALRHVEAYSWRRLEALLGQRPSQNPLNRRLASTNAPKKPTGSTSGPSFSPTPTASAAPDAKLKTADGNKTKASDEDEGPQPLIRPLGVALRPSAGDNTGIDPRSWKQRRDDFLNYDKHLVRRKELTAQMARPYFRDWSNMRNQQGKVFIAPERIFRSTKALYFPNLRGITAADATRDHDTTPVLSGHISVVSVYTGTWAQQQTESFVEKNAQLQQMLAEASSILKGSKDTEQSRKRSFLQHVQINTEPNRMRHAIVKFFLGRQRRSMPEAQWPRYFVVHRGFEQAMRERLGMFNGQVGYVFLVDAFCRIRWAGSAVASAQEVDSMNRAVVRIAREHQKLLEDKENRKNAAAEDDVFDMIAQGFWDQRVLGKVVDGIAKVLEA